MNRLGLVHRIVVGLMAVFGVLVLGGAVSQVRFVLMARRTDATVARHVAKEGSTSHSERSRKADGTYEDRIVSRRFMGQAPVLRFVVDDHVVEFEGVAHAVDPQYPVGSRVTVVYDPLRPEYAFIEEDAPGWAGVVGSTLFGLVFVGGALLVMIVFGGWGRYFPRLRIS